MADVEISFVESLLGFSHPLTLLSGKSLDVGRSGITLGGMRETFHGEGMPSADTGFTALVVLYSVALPSQLTPAQQQVINRVLSPSSAAKGVVEQQMNSASSETASSGEVWWDSTAGELAGDFGQQLQQAAALQQLRQEALWETASTELEALHAFAAGQLWLWRMCLVQDCLRGAHMHYPTSEQYGAGWQSTGRTCFVHRAALAYIRAAQCTGQA